MKKITCFSIILCFILLCGCQSVSKTSANANSSPEAIVSEFIKISQKNNTDKMNSCIDSTVQSEFSQYLSFMTDSDITKIFSKYIKNYSKLIDYEIKNIDVDGNEATVTLNVKYKNISEFFMNAFLEVMSKFYVLEMSGTEYSSDDIAKVVNSYLDENKSAIESLELSEYELHVECINNSGKWYILSDITELLDLAYCGIFTPTSQMIEYGND